MVLKASDAHADQRLVGYLLNDEARRVTVVAGVPGTDRPGPVGVMIDVGNEDNPPVFDPIELLERVVFAADTMYAMCDDETRGRWHEAKRRLLNDVES